MILEGDGCWALDGARSSYVIALGPDDRWAELLYWGPRLTDPLALGQRRHREAGSHKRTPADLSPLEYAPWGVRHLTDCDLLPIYADGVRGSVWEFAGAERRGDELRIRFDDSRGLLRLDLHYHSRPAWDLVERWATVENLGQAPIVLERCRSGGFNLFLDAPVLATYLSGAWAAEFGVREATLGPGSFTIESRGGMTGHEHTPWLAIQPVHHEELRPRSAWGVALAWSGSWKLTVECPPEGMVRVAGGLNDFDSPLTLGPGERLVTPALAGVYSDGGLAGLRHRLHGYQRACLRRPRSSPLPVVFNSWESTYFAVTAGHQKQLAGLAADLGCEVFVVDDGWFRGRRDDRGGLGDWEADPEKFPEGLEDLARHVEKLGMRFGLWVEPEGVSPASALYRAHPDWVLGFPDRPGTQIRHQLVLNLANPDAAAWVRETLLGLLDRYPISYLKWDMNRPLTEPGWMGADPATARSVWVRYVENLYAILDALRRHRPSLIIEGCAGGGGRTDLGMLGHVDVIWTSDNTAPLDRLVIQHGFLQAYAPSWMSCWVTDSPGRNRAGEVSLEFRFCAAMAGVLGIGAGIEHWEDERRGLARRMVGLYKEVRETIQEGRVDVLGSPLSGRAYAIQYTRDAEVVVLAWWDRGLRNSGAVADRGLPVAGDARLVPRPTLIRLLGLEPRGRYRVRGGDTVLTGSELEYAGLSIPWALAPDADLVVLDRAD